MLLRANYTAHFQIMYRPLKHLKSNWHFSKDCLN